MIPLLCANTCKIFPTKIVFSNLSNCVQFSNLTDRLWAVRVWAAPWSTLL